MRQHSSRVNKFDPAEFPHLAEFARGYLHQDLIPEYGSVLQATQAYLHDLSASERKQTASEAFRFRGAVQHWSNQEMNEAIAALGGAWAFISKDELNEMLQTIERGR